MLGYARSLLILIYSALWLEQCLLAAVLLTATALFITVFVSKLLKTNLTLKNELRRNVYIDLNTRLPNRLKLLKDAKKLDSSIDSTLIIINIDSFQNTNNFYGHNFGDRFLKVIGEWLSNNLPPINATLYKFEADIYAILIRAPLS